MRFLLGVLRYLNTPYSVSSQWLLWWHLSCYQIDCGTSEGNELISGMERSCGRPPPSIPRSIVGGGMCALSIKYVIAVFIKPYHLWSLISYPGYGIYIVNSVETDYSWPSVSHSHSHY